MTRSRREEKAAAAPPPGTEPARRGPARATRRRLLEAGTIAFASKGLAGVNLRNDILAPAGVSVGSFYHQFSDKTQLLLAILEEHAEAFRTRLHEVHMPTPGRSSRDTAKAAYALVFELADSDDAIWRIQMKERDSRDPRVREYLRANRERWVDRLAEDYDRMRSSAPPREGSTFDADLAARLVVGLCLTAMAEYLETPTDGRAAARERLLTGLVDFSMGGIAAVGATRNPD